MLEYPPVAGEFETIRKLLDGFSIARFGDGELKVMDKHVYVRESLPVPKLAEALKRIAQAPLARCLIGIPTLDPAGDRYENWDHYYRHRLLRYFHSKTGVTYWSAFITRPDCGTQWLDTREYYELVIQLWQGKQRVAVVSEANSKLLAYLRDAVPRVTHVECPMYGAYAEIERLEREVLDASPDLTVLSAGPTATVLAHRLTKHGLQTLDLGSMGGFLMRWRDGGPRPVTRDDYAAERLNGSEAHA